MAPHDPERSRFKRIRRLGTGGSAEVWLVHDRVRPGTPLALKELDVTVGQATEQRFRQEFSTLAALVHPNLARVHDFLISETGCLSFTLDFVDGPDLVQAIRAQGPEAFNSLAAEALRALSFLHDFGLVHRDLKPANLLVRRRPHRGSRLVVLDFGLALQGGEGSGNQGPVGTLPYLAPEVLEGKIAGPTSDLYGLGCVLHEAIYGAPPVPLDPDNLTQFFDSVRSGKRPPRTPDVDYEPTITRWLEYLLRVDPAERPDGAREALGLLAESANTRFPIETPETRKARLESGRPPGRTDTLNRIEALLTEPRGPSLVLITGDAGSGKSRILRWMESEAVRRGFDVKPLLAQQMSEWWPRGELPDRLETLRRSAREGPVLATADECENANPALTRILDRVARDPDREPIIVAAGMRQAELRSEVLRRLLDDASFVPSITKVELRPLTAVDVAELIKRATGVETVPELQTNALLDSSEGNVSILETLLVEGAFEAGSPLPKRPRSVEESIDRRILSLPIAQRHWLEALACVGQDLPIAAVNLISGLSVDEIPAAAEAAESLGLVIRDEAGWSVVSRLASTRIETLGEPDRIRKIYRDAARNAEASEPPGPASLLAYLWRGAKDRKQSVRHALQQAETAEKTGDVAAAADWYRFALLQTDRQDRDRGVLRLKHARLLFRAEKLLPAARAFASVLRFSPEIPDAFGVLIEQSVALSQDLRRRALTVAEKAMTIAESSGDAENIRRAHCAMGIALCAQGRHREVVEEVEKGFEVADIRLRAYALHVAGLSHSNMREFDAATRRFSEALDLARQAGIPSLQAKALMGSAIAARRSSQREKAVEFLERAKRVADQHQLQRWRVDSLYLMTVMNLTDGYYHRALTTLRELEPLTLATGQRSTYLLAINARADILIRTGRPGEAIELIQGALDRSLDGFDPSITATARLTLIEALLASPQPPHERIVRDLEALVNDPACSPRSRFAALVVDLERRADQRDAEFEAAWKRLASHTGKFGAPTDPEWETRGKLARGRCLMANDEFDEALETIVDATSTADILAFPETAAAGKALEAEVLDQRGRKNEADAARKTGLQILEQAAERIEDEEMRRGFLDRPIFAPLQRRESRLEAINEDRLSAIYDMIRTLNSETEPAFVLETMLDMALRVVRAERGMILLRDPGAGENDYTVRLARNLEQRTIEEAADFSRNVVLQAGAGKSVLAMDTGQDERLRDLKSVSMFGIRSVLCVPLRSRESIIGAVYLDSRTEGALFSTDDLRFLEAFADHAALALENAQIHSNLERENRRLQVAAQTRTRFGDLIGRSAPMQQVYDLLEKIADSRLPVLIQGESGTGKELVARAIHRHSLRRRKPYLTENCASITETLLESELFGHVKGAFTGADRNRVGLFEQAHGGTLFLDEVGDMPLTMQARLLRVIQEGEIRPVGGETRTTVDVRLLTATHRDLHKAVDDGTFREDLLYRLQVLCVVLPPLRERPGDVPLLVEHFLERIASERDRPTPRIHASVMDLLERCDWPGNVRQLENTLQRLTLLAGDGPVDRATVESDEGLGQALIGASSTGPAMFSLELNEREKIRQALEAVGGHRTRAAKMLGISRATIFRKIKEYGLS